ncbi:Variant-specific surface protein [Giardia duodenalis]|uniref:Variant-specific surface protein n=1 Tax=Giardia intestinalis TaxID=5741 RepID=V6TN60_GIAIN|nr:Variant-specific surface protein [Giardia intestinalis]
MCSGGFFLFMGGCYSQQGTPGSEICTAAEGGKCTACNTKDNYIFQNRAATVTPGNECILCSDAKGADGVTGVENCNKCTVPDSAGAATCDTCQDGYYKDQGTGACQKCDQTCATCENAADTCTSCPEGKYLNGNTCVEDCGNGKYADPTTNECKNCATETSISECTACTYSSSLQKPVCSACGGSKPLLKTAIDGTTTCVDDAECPTGGMNFLSDSPKACLLCNDTTGTGNNLRKEGCMTCTKSSGAPVCSACLSGYYGTDTCTKCAANCATCTSAAINDCTACLPRYFLKAGSTNECVPCGDVDKDGIEGCATCSFSTSLTCSSCKPNYRQSGSDSVTCTKVCEDPTACGGTAGACEAIVINGSGEMTYYCSLCGDSNQYPIDGICKGDSAKGSNTCDKGVCTSCTTGYFLYMGGCYKADQPPGNLMCTAAAGGICTTPTGQYFKVPGAASTDQSVLGCGNPLGTTVSGSAYVGLEGCKTCTAPSEAPSGAMAPARCTACSSNNKKPSLLGSGCFTCAMEGCSHCSADNACEACTSAEQRPSTDGTKCIACNISGCARCSEASKCSQCGDGYWLESDTCVPTGPNLSSGAIAGISVAVIVIVGGLVGFLCWCLCATRRNDTRWAADNRT